MSRRTLIAVVVLVLGLAALGAWFLRGGSGAATATERAFLWRIETARPSYLYGTIHVPDRRVLAVPQAVRDSVAACDVFYTEIPLDRESTASVAQRFLHGQGTPLERRLPEAMYARLIAHLQKRSLTVAPLERMEVWAIPIALLSIEMRKYGGESTLDSFLRETAQKLGKRVDALETIEEQIATLAGFAPDEQLALLSETLDLFDEQEREGTDHIGELVKLYLTGDEGKLMDAMFEYVGDRKELQRKFLQRVLWDRNQRMVERIHRKLQAEPDTGHFFAIGAAHYPADQGILKLLRARGYEIVRLD